MGDKRTAIPASVAGPSAEGTLMALTKEFEQVLEKFPNMCQKGMGIESGFDNDGLCYVYLLKTNCARLKALDLGKQVQGFEACSIPFDRAQWEKLSRNLDSSCTVGQRVEALAFVVDCCRNMFRPDLTEISPDLDASSRHKKIRQETTQQRAPLQHVNDLLLHVFTADQTGYGDLQCWCFKYHWDCLIILKVVTQHVSELLGKSNADSDIRATATATAAAFNLAVGCLVRCWHIVRCHSGTAPIDDIFVENLKLNEGILSAADKPAIEFLVLKFRRMMINFVCDHSYTILKGMADSAALTVDKKFFITWLAFCNENVPSLRRTAEDKHIKQSLDQMFDLLNRVTKRYVKDQEPTDAQLNHLVEWMEPQVKTFPPGVLRPYGGSVETCFYKMWDSDIQVCKALHSGALAEDTARWRLLRAAPYLCAVYGLGSVLTFGMSVFVRMSNPA